VRLEGRVRMPSWRRGARAKEFDMHYERMNQKRICTCPASPTRSFSPSEMKLIALCV